MTGNAIYRQLPGAHGLIYIGAVAMIQRGIPQLISNVNSAGELGLPSILRIDRM